MERSLASLIPSPLSKPGTICSFYVFLWLYKITAVTAPSCIQSLQMFTKFTDGKIKQVMGEPGSKNCGKIREKPLLKRT